jgi:mono/diheme cytochrome c family protein
MMLIPCAWRRAQSVFVWAPILASLAALGWPASVRADRAPADSFASKTGSGAAIPSFSGPRFGGRLALAPPVEPPSSEVRTSALKLYSKLCAKCHKVDGIGGKTRSTAVPDFTKPAWQEERSDHQLRVSIRDGKGADMPTFVDRPSEKELDDLVAFVRSFAPTERPAGPKPNDTDFESRFRKLESEWEQLRRDFWELNDASRKEKRNKDPERMPDQ